MIKIDKTFNVKGHKISYLIGIILFVLGIATIMFFSGMQTQEMPEQSEFHNYSTVVEQKAHKAEAIKGISTRSDILPSVMYKYIEPIPEDFYNKRHKFRYPKYFEDMDVCGLDSEYYNQPEWFLHFEERAMPNILSAELGRHGISVYPQIYPSDQIISMQHGTTAEICTLLRTSYLTELYVGMRPEIKYLNKIEIKPDFYGIDAINVQSIDIDEAREHIKVTVTPNDFYLRPSYPIFGGIIYEDNPRCNLLGCDENVWTKKLRIKVEVDKDIEPGNYAIGIDFIKPSPEYEKEWYYQFNLVYKSVGGVIKVNMGREPYQLLVQVN